MSKTIQFTDEFKRDAVVQVVEHRNAISELAQLLTDGFEQEAKLAGMSDECQAIQIFREAAPLPTC